jgi:hypothetical protein
VLSFGVRIGTWCVDPAVMFFVVRAAIERQAHEQD